VFSTLIWPLGQGFVRFLVILGVFGGLVPVLALFWAFLMIVCLFWLFGGDLRFFGP
jgi:hypothetical protein